MTQPRLLILTAQEYDPEILIVSPILDEVSDDDLYTLAETVMDQAKREHPETEEHPDGWDFSHLRAALEAVGFLSPSSTIEGPRWDGELAEEEEEEGEAA